MKNFSLGGLTLTFIMLAFTLRFYFLVKNFWVSVLLPDPNGQYTKLGWYFNMIKLNNDNYWLAFWSKLFKPLATMALVLMAISFIFGPLRSVTLGQRVFIGVLVGFAFQISQDLLSPASLVFGFSPLIAVLLPSVCCAGIGFFLLHRAS